MEPAAVSPFAAWESFYVIIGSSGAALTGLQFVVIALSAEGRATRTAQSVGAFGTPTVVHFCAVLLLAGILSMPWHAVSSAALALGICGAAGMVYALIVVRRAVRHDSAAVHAALFPEGVPTRKALAELKQGVTVAMRRRHSHD